jgi:molybdate/tungstate transport system permease protein
MLPTGSPTEAGSTGGGSRPDWLTATSLLGGVLLLYYGVPLLALVLAQRPGAVLARVTTPAVATAARNSLVSASITTAIAAGLGVPLAYWLARADGRWVAAVDALVLLPLVLPPTVGGIVLLTVVGPNTPVGASAAALGVPLTRSLAGVVLAQMFVASPFVVVTAKAAFGGVDRRLEHASRSLGKRRWTTFRRVTLPLAWPGIIAGTTLTFARALSEFGATLMLAYYPRTMPVQIWVAFLERGLESAYPIAILLLALALGALAILSAAGTDPWNRSRNPDRERSE